MQLISYCLQRENYFEIFALFDPDRAGKTKMLKEVENTYCKTSEMI